MTSAAKSVISLLALCASLLLGTSTHANRITIITHGYNASVDEWIVPMAAEMAGYTTFWGTSSSCYQISVSTNSNGAFQVTSQFLDGTPAPQTDSGNIFIKLDWSNVAGEFNSIFNFYPAPYDVTSIAEVVAPALRDANLISDLNGRAIAEFPLHLVGHSRGGPLITEIARLLGANGIWVDQITTLDPHPCDPTVFPESIGCPVNDVDPVLYENVFFADNYWQNEDSTDGQLVTGAYNRFLSNLSNGYPGSHSDTHLWYHGTIGFGVPLTIDGATLSQSERTTWFAIGETNGTWAGYLNSLIGGGDRFSDERPAGPTTQPIQDGVLGSRVTLPNNDGTWPNMITFNAVNLAAFPFRSETGLAVREENVVIANTTLEVNGDYQSGQDADVTFFLDPDANSLNENEIVLSAEQLDATGTLAVSNIVRSLAVDSATIANGIYFLGANITVTPSGATRTIYAPQKIAVLEPLRLLVLPLSATESQLTVTGSAGYEAIIESTTSLPGGWNASGLNAFAGEPIGTPVSVENVIGTGTGTEFFRARYQKPAGE